MAIVISYNPPGKTLVPFVCKRVVLCAVCIAYCLATSLFFAGQCYLLFETSNSICHSYLYVSLSVHPLFSLSQVGVNPPPSTAGIITPSNALLPTAKIEILHLVKTVIEKCSAQVSSVPLHG